MQRFKFCFNISKDFMSLQNLLWLLQTLKKIKSLFPPNTDFQTQKVKHLKNSNDLNTNENVFVESCRGLYVSAMLACFKHHRWTHLCILCPQIHDLMRSAAELKSMATGWTQAQTEFFAHKRRQFIYNMEHLREIYVQWDGRGSREKGVIHAHSLLFSRNRSKTPLTPPHTR